MKKNPHAVALGRKGGKRGGKSRMASMTPAQRRAFARAGGLARAARARKEAREKELAAKIHDGRWMMERLPPFRRVDWSNLHRDRTVGLFGVDFFRQRMLERIRQIAA